MNIPEQIWKLGEERAAARQARDFALADRLRERLAELGWEIFDQAGSFELREKLKYTVIENLRAMTSIIEPCEIAITMIIQGFQADAGETVQSIRHFTDVPIVLLTLGEVGPLVEVIDAHTVVIKVNEDCGWGPAANALLQNIPSQFLIIMDPSTRFLGDAISPVLAALREGTFAGVGWKGGLINMDDEWRSVDDKGPGEVDVLFSYFLALDRQAAIEVGGFNARALYYRNADIEFSLRMRHAGGHLRQMELPLMQDRHHGYHDVDSDFREIQSKKNYDRILERFRGKNAILSPRR
ncbi:MAG: hypothetical protein Q8K86_03460 [Candidatus Nanopelagicaceae bacterium]|nr:hypothetical protein [Candidatus Nanopelagicaceae bacterium]